LAVGGLDVFSGASVAVTAGADFVVEGAWGGEGISAIMGLEIEAK